MPATSQPTPIQTTSQFEFLGWLTSTAGEFLHENVIDAAIIDSNGHSRILSLVLPKLEGLKWRSSVVPTQEPINLRPARLRVPPTRPTREEAEFLAGFRFNRSCHYLNEWESVLACFKAEAARAGIHLSQSPTRDEIAYTDCLPLEGRTQEVVIREWAARMGLDPEGFPKEEARFLAWAKAHSCNQVVLPSTGQIMGHTPRLVIPGQEQLDSFVSEVREHVDFAGGGRIWILGHEIRDLVSSDESSKWQMLYASRPDLHFLNSKAGMAALGVKSRTTWRSLCSSVGVNPNRLARSDLTRIKTEQLRRRNQQKDGVRRANQDPKKHPR